MSAKIIIISLIFLYYVSSGSCYDQFISVYRLNSDSSRKDIGKIFTNNISCKMYRIITVRNTLAEDNSKNNELFQVDETSGMLSMSSNLDGNFELSIQMEIKSRRATKRLLVHVDITELTESMIQNSGSIQFYGITAEDFIDRANNENLYDQFIRTIQIEINLHNLNCYSYNFPTNKVKIFAINQNLKNASLLDVRFKVTSKNTNNVEHLLHFMLMQDKNSIENKLGINITAININECSNEGIPCESSCYNKLSISNGTQLVQKKNLSFLGLNITTNAVCEFQKDLSSFSKQTNKNLVLVTKCSVYYPPIQPNKAFTISFNVIPTNLNGVLLYFGPFYSHNPNDKDFLLLELNNGLPTLVIEFGSGEIIIPSKCILTLSVTNSVNIIIHENNIEINIMNGDSSSCRTSGINKGTHKVLNINTPTRIGGQNFEIFTNKLNKTYHPLNYYINGELNNLQIKNYNVDKTDQVDEQNNVDKINNADEQNNEISNNINQKSGKTMEIKSGVELQSSQNTIFYIIIGILIAAVIFLIFLLKKSKVVKSSYVIADKQIQLPNSELKETIADKLVEIIDPYATLTDIRNGESNLYSEIQNDAIEHYSEYVDVEDIKPIRDVPKSIADLYSVVNKNPKKIINLRNSNKSSLMNK